jgi:signal transduction histidine kinase
MSKGEFFNRRTRIFRLSSFRLTLAYAGMFCLSFLVLFALVYWYALRLVEAQIDTTVASEIAEIRANAGGAGIEGLRAAVDVMTDRAPGFYYLLQDDSGRALAGNLPAMMPLDGVQEMQAPLPPAHGHSAGLRGRGVVLPDEAAYLFVGLGTFELHELEEFVTRSFLWGMVATVLLALAGGSLISLRVLRKVEAVARTSRDIIGGDLARRLPVSGADDEFDRLATSLNAMLARIQDLMEDIRQVSSDIAHDLRTPITRLRQRLEYALRGAGSTEDMRRTMEEALAEIDSILATFGALLRIAQIESGARRSAFTRIDLSELLLRVAAAYEPVAAERGQTLAAAVPPGLAVHGDRALLTQLFANLIENAIQHSPDGAAIAVSAMAGGEALEIAVADNGPGIPEPFREKVFQRFFRLEESRTSDGNGLGLSLVAAIAALHEVPVLLEDNQPGLVVRLRFAASPRADEASGEAPSLALGRPRFAP